MKRILQITLLLIMQGVSLGAFAQNGESFRSVEVRYGRTGTTGDIFKLLHERYLSEKLNITVALSAELSRKNLINYRCYAVDVLAEYYTGLGFKTNDDFQVKGGVGVSVNYQTEPTLYKDFKVLQKINYGVIFQVTGEWAFTDDLSLTASAAQRLYKKKILGMFQYEYALGIKWKIF